MGFFLPVINGPGTQMTLVLLEKGLVLEGSTPKIEDVHRFQGVITPIGRVK